MPSLKARGAVFLLVSVFSICSEARIEPKSRARKTCNASIVNEIHGDAGRESPIQAMVVRVKNGDCIPDGNAVFTRTKATLGLRLASAATARIAPDTELLLGFPIGGRPTKLHLTRGEVEIIFDGQDENDAPILSALRATVIPKSKNTQVFAEVFHSGEQGFVVVAHGSVVLRIGDQPAQLVPEGNSVYFTEDQKEVPKPQPLDSREYGELTHDRGFHKTISQLMMIESGAEDKDDEGGHDLTLQEYVAQEQAQKTQVKGVPVPPQPISQSVTQRPNQPITPPAPTPLLVIPSVQATPNAVFATPNPVSHLVLEPLDSPAMQSSSVEKASSAEVRSTTKQTETPVESAIRFSAGPAFYGDSLGFDFAGAYMTQAAHLFSGLSQREGTEFWSLGGGLGYDHASKNNLSVSNVNVFVLTNYRFELSSVLNLSPEFAFGPAVESVATPNTTFGKGLALYCSPRVTLEARLAHDTAVFAGLTAALQEYLGQVGLTSMSLQGSIRFGF
jgi:hypothetical protein